MTEELMAVSLAGSWPDDELLKVRPLYIMIASAINSDLATNSASVLDRSAEYSCIDLKSRLKAVFYKNLPLLRP